MEQKNFPSAGVELQAINVAQVNNNVDTAEAETTSVESLSEAEKEASETKVLHLTLDGKKLADANSLLAKLNRSIEHYAACKVGVDRNYDAYEIGYNDVELFNEGTFPYESVVLIRDAQLMFKKNGVYYQGIIVTVKVEVNNF